MSTITKALLLILFVIGVIIYLSADIRKAVRERSDYEDLNVKWVRIIGLGMILLLFIFLLLRKLI